MFGFMLFISMSLLISVAVKIVLKYKIEVALFTTFCAFTLLIAVSALLGFIQIMIFVIYALAAASGIFLVAYIIKNPVKAKDALTDIFSPGMIIFLVSCLIYYILVQDKVLIHDDEAGSWASQVKYMFETNIYKSFSSHSHILGFFTLLNVKIMGYHEWALFFSLWAFKWSALILALKGLKWNKWYIALIFSVGALGIVSLLSEFEPAYYMDMVLGILAGSLCAAWSIGQHTRKDYIWLYMGLAVLVNIKDELGTVIAVLTSLFCIAVNISRYYLKPESERRLKKTDVLLNTGVLFISMLFAFLSPSIVNILNKMIELLGYIYFFAAIAVLAAIIIVIVISRKKIGAFVKKRKYPVIITVSVLLLTIVLGAFALVYSNIAIDSWRRVEVLLFRLWSEPFFNKPTHMLVFLGIIFSALTSIFLIEKKHVKQFAVESGFILLSVPIFAIALLAGFILSTGTFFDHYMTSFTRYYAPVILMAAVWFLSKMTGMESEYKIKHGQIATSLVLLIALASQIPVAGSTALSNLEPIRYTFTYKLRPDMKEQAGFIKENIGDKKVLIASSTNADPWDPYTAALWLNYELIPMNTGKAILVGEDSDYIFTSNNHEFTPDEFLDYMKRRNFDYVYFYNKNEFIDNTYGELMDYTPENNCILYKVTPDAEHYLSFIKAKD